MPGPAVLIQAGLWNVWEGQEAGGGEATDSSESVACCVARPFLRDFENERGTGSGNIKGYNILDTVERLMCDCESVALPQ